MFMDKKDLKKIRGELASVIEDNINPQFEIVHKRFEDVNKRFEDVNKRFEDVNKHFGRIEATMVTKSYLDEKLADLSGDLVVKLKKEDAKLSRLVEILKRKKVLDKNEVKELAEYQIFPRFARWKFYFLFY